MTIGCPSTRPSWSPMARATVSAAPPGAKPTTRRIGFAGQACAPAPGAMAQSSEAMRTGARRRFMALLFSCDLDDDLPEVRVRFHVRLCRGHLGELEHLV